jgi:hypothetical protein
MASLARRPTLIEVDARCRTGDLAEVVRKPSASCRSAAPIVRLARFRQFHSRIGFVHHYYCSRAAADLSLKGTDQAARENDPPLPRLLPR